jgi:tetratricopeptide (TPR) repeat protein
MSEPDSALESSIPLFDVVINVPPGARLVEIERLAREVSGIAPDRIERLMQVLQGSPQAKIGAGVTREKADLAREQFTKAGLLVTVTPLLTIQAAMAGSLDGTTVCPACDKRVVLPENRQCPACGIFVDKVTDEFLLRRKLLEQERGKIEFAQAKSAKDSDKRARELMEASVRAKVRAELEKEYGIKGEKPGLFPGSARLFKGVGLIGLLALAFFGGRGFSTEGLPFGKSASGKAATAPAAMTPESLEKAAQAAGADADIAAGGAASAPGNTGDPDVDDPLIQAVAGKPPGGKQLTLEQALAASKTLAKSVGNTTAERAAAGGAVGGKPGSAASQAANDAIDSAIDNPSSSAASGASTGAGGTASGPSQGGGSKAPSGIAFNGGNAAGAEAGTSAVPKQTKLVLAAEFARTLAELGQSGRAKGVLKPSLAAVDPAAQPEAAVALRSAELKSQAWAIQRREVPAGKAAEELKTKILAVTNPVERTQLLAQSAVILSRGGQLSADFPRVFLSLAAESLKTVPDAAQVQALGDLAVSMGEVFGNEASARARAGSWSKAQASAAQIEGLLKQAPDPWTQLRLHALDHQVQLQLGQNDKARKSLDTALALAGKNSNLAERATWLRSIAQLGDAAAQEQLEAAIATLESQLESKSGLEKAKALSQLSLLYANGGLPARADKYRRQAQSTAGLSPAESDAVNTDLIVRSDLAMARVLQGLGRYAEAESMLQRVGGYLF